MILTIRSVNTTEVVGKGCDHLWRLILTLKTDGTSENQGADCGTESAHECRLEATACAPALQRVRASSVAGVNSFFGIPALLSLRESCMRENRTCSLGGRRRARKCLLRPEWRAVDRRGVHHFGGRENGLYRCGSWIHCRKLAFRSRLESIEFLGSDRKGFGW